MRRRHIHVLNWDKYQARTDKELPWCKLWGTLFKRPWFQELADDEKFVTIVFLDLARQFNNRIPDLSEFKGYLRGNYGVFMSEERVFKLCNLLSHNEFLSDNMSALQDKIRQDKIRVDITSDKQPKFRKPTLEELKSHFAEKLSPSCGSPLSEAERFFNYYESKGWVVGKSPMKNWKAAVSNWIGNLNEKTKTYTTPNPNKKFLDAKKAFDEQFNSVF